MAEEVDNSKVKNTVNVTSGALETLQSFRWKIKNFAVVKANSDLLKKQCFRFEIGGDKGESVSTQWCFYLDQSEKSCGLYSRLEKITCLSPSEVNEVFMSCDARKIKPNGEPSRTTIFKCSPRSRTVNGTEWGFPTFLVETEESLKQLIWEDGSLVIEVDVKIFTIEPATMDLNERVRIFEKNEMQNFINSMTRMVEDENKMKNLGQVKMVTKDKVEYLVNPAILSARSPVFKAMFSSGNWKEGQLSEEGASIILEDLSGKTVKVLLHYLYGSVLLKDDWQDEDVILELTWAAEKYQLESLSEFLDKVLADLPLKSMDLIGKLALLTKRLGMKTAENGLLKKLKEEANDIDQLILDKNDALMARWGHGQILTNMIDACKKVWRRFAPVENEGTL